MKSWISFLDHTPAALADLVTLAQRIKRGETDEHRKALAGKGLVMVFFNPSLRTRTSFEAAMAKAGGHAICLSVGGDAWMIETRDGVKMDGACAEHIREAAPVLGRYGDFVAVRTFAGMKDAAEDARDGVIRGFEQLTRKPVINMESASEHPCQGLADWMTMREKLGETRGRRFVLSWAPHIKPLPMAVPHSALMAAAAAGMDITIAHPAGYGLNPKFVEAASQCSRVGGGSVRVQSNQDACRDADVVYAKSWGAARHYGDAAAQQAEMIALADWMVTPAHLGPRTQLMHCLPVRRDVEVAASALDDPRCIVVDQAENRLWAQLAILTRLTGR